MISNNNLGFVSNINIDGDTTCFINDDDGSLINQIAIISISAPIFT